MHFYLSKLSNTLNTLNLEKLIKRTQSYFHDISNEGRNDQMCQEACKHTDQIPCVEGHSVCYNITDIFVYRLNKYHQLVPCRQGEHLQNCEEFECNNMFKCPNFYCIPWSYVCDGLWDCPNGYDGSPKQNCAPNRVCTNFFKYWYSQTCIHLGNVCDGYKGCHEGDDELLCEIHKILCPSVCSCLALAISCIKTNLSSTDLPAQFPYLAFTVVYSIISSLKSLMTSKNVMKFINFQGNNIDEVCNLYINLYHIVIIDNSNNSIEYIQKDCFHNLYHLKYIDLSKNVIQNIESKAFNNLPELNYINFSNNQITYLPSNIIYKSFHTLTISAQHNTIKKIDTNVFSTLKIHMLETSDDRLCCFVLPDVICTAVRPWYKSRTNLLTNISIQVTFVLISLSIIITNSLSVFIHSTLFEVNRSFKKTVLAINLNDMICGIYLTIIWVAAFYFNENYVVKDKQWKSNPLCFVCFAATLLFSLFYLVYYSFYHCPD